MSTVLLTVENHIATVTLNRPEALNAMDTPMRQEVVAAWQRVKQDDDIRLAVVTGAGRAFCAGMDVKEAAERVARDDATADPGASSTYLAGVLPYDIPKPVIGAINGAAAGGGLGIALSCDFLLASEDAFFVAPFAVRGTVNATILALLAAKVPHGWASWMAMSSVRVDAQIAQRMGLVNEVFPQNQLLDQAYDMADRILANSYVAVLAIKEKLRQVLETTMWEGFTVTGPLAAEHARSSESREGFQAFTEKRRAQFK